MSGRTHPTVNIARFPSVPLLNVSLDTLTNEDHISFGRLTAKTTAGKGIWEMPGLPEGKAGTVIIGLHEGAPLEDSKSSLSLYNPLSSLESLRSSQPSSGGPRLQPSADTTGGKELHLDSASGEDSHPRRSSRRHGGDRQLKEKRKVGRPIAYCGDPNSPDLSPPERRRIMRRIANRESARRVRSRRQDLLADMALKAQAIEEANAGLLARAQSVEEKHQAMLSQASQLKQSLSQKSAETEALQSQIASLKQALSSGGSAQQSIDRTMFRDMAAQQQIFFVPAAAATPCVSPPLRSAFKGAEEPFTAALDGFQGDRHFDHAPPAGFPAASSGGPAPVQQAVPAPSLNPLEHSFSDFLRDVTF